MSPLLNATASLFAASSSRAPTQGVNITGMTKRAPNFSVAMRVMRDATIEPAGIKQAGDPQTSHRIVDDVVAALRVETKQDYFGMLKLPK